MTAMDLSTYSGLQAAIASFLWRADLTDQITGFITLAEAQIGRRVRRKTITKSVTIASPSTPLPADCVELRSGKLVTSSQWQDVPLRNATPEILAETNASYNSTGRPIAMTLQSGNLIVAPAPDTSYAAELRYFEKLVPLSATNATNSVLAESPDIYLYGALSHAAPYLEHDERIAVWEAKFEKAVNELDAQREREETGASLRPARLPRRLG